VKIEATPLGRIVIPPRVPEGFALFWTTIDFAGHLDAEVARSIAEIAGISAPLASCNQVHSAVVLKAVAGATALQKCDALWSDTRPALLAIKIADCLPVTIIDAERHVIVNIHAGWRGAAQRITAVALDEAPVDTKNALAWLGPTIRGCCFEVGEEVVDQLRAAYGDIDPYVDRTRAKPHVDIAGITGALLRDRGFASDRIIDSGLCTRCDGSIFHSYRRGARGGRNLAIVGQ